MSDPPRLRSLSDDLRRVVPRVAGFVVRISAHGWRLGLVLTVDRYRTRVQWPLRWRGKLSAGIRRLAPSRPLSPSSRPPARVIDEITVTTGETKVEDSAYAEDPATLGYRILRISHFLRVLRGA